MFTLGVQEYVELIEDKKNGITLLSALAIMTVVILSAIPMFAFAEEEGGGAQVAGMEDGEKDTAGLTSHSTEYIAIAGISITAAWFVSSTVNKIRKTILLQ